MIAKLKRRPHFEFSERLSVPVGQRAGTQSCRKVFMRPSHQTPL